MSEYTTMTINNSAASPMPNKPRLVLRVGFAGSLKMDAAVYRDAAECLQAVMRQLLEDIDACDLSGNSSTHTPIGIAKSPSPSFASLPVLPKGLMQLRGKRCSHFPTNLSPLSLRLYSPDRCRTIGPPVRLCTIRNSTRRFSTVPMCTAWMACTIIPRPRWRQIRRMRFTTGAS